MCLLCVFCTFVPKQKYQKFSTQKEEMARHPFQIKPKPHRVCADLSSFAVVAYLLSFFLQTVIIVTQMILSAKAKTDETVVFLPHTRKHSLGLLSVTVVQIENCDFAFHSALRTPHSAFKFLIPNSLYEELLRRAARKVS